MTNTLLAMVLLYGGAMEPLGQTATSSGQTGGVTAFSVNTLNYYNLPPVTEQERAIALERLKLTLNDLATYNERPADLGQLTVLEGTRTEHVARRLYLVLSSFFDPTIQQADNAKDLLEFKREYSLFVRTERQREQQSLEYIGKFGPAKLGWEALFQYSVLRVFRGSKDAVMASGLTLIEATPDQAEALHLKFISDPEGGAWLPVAVQTQENLINSASILLKPYSKF